MVSRTFYNSFIRQNLDYTDIIYGKPHKSSFIEKKGRVQDNATLVITGASKGTSKERLYSEFGLGSLKIVDDIKNCVSFTKLGKYFRLNT